MFVKGSLSSPACFSRYANNHYLTKPPSVRPARSSLYSDCRLLTENFSHAKPYHASSLKLCGLGGEYALLAFFITLPRSASFGLSSSLELYSRCNPPHAFVVEFTMKIGGFIAPRRGV